MHAAVRQFGHCGTKHALFRRAEAQRSKDRISDSEPFSLLPYPLTRAFSALRRRHRRGRRPRKFGVSVSQSAAETNDLPPLGPLMHGPARIG